MRIIVSALFTCACINMQAQVNLVKNPSFEQYSVCPTNNDEVKDAWYWNCLDSNYNPLLGILPPPGVDCAPDYRNECDTDTELSVPANEFFYHYPRTGKAMMQVVMYTSDTIEGGIPNTYLRDYLQGHLYHTLITGQSYCVTFYAVLEGTMRYSVNKLGVYLDDGSVDTASMCGLPQTGYNPQIIDTNVISDTLNWTRVQGSFIANGSENFITIGNFFADGDFKMDTAYGAVTYAGYLIDDVSVIESNTTAYAGPDVTIAPGDSTYIGLDSNGEGMPCYWYVQGSTTAIDSGGRILVKPDSTTSYVVSMDLCGNVTYDTVVVHVHTEGINNVQIQSVQIFPNPAGGELTITADNKITDVLITNLVGQTVYSRAYNADKVTVEVGDLMPGIYFVKVNNSVERRFMKE